MRQVVVGVDGSKDGLIALHWAVDTAARRGWPVRVVHVADDSGADELAPAMVQMLVPDDGTEVLEEAADELSRMSAPSARMELRHGDPAATLLELGKGGGMLVVGRRGMDGFAELSVGSVSQFCAALAEVPVVVVPDRWNPAAPPAGRIVVGVDGSESSADALDFAFDEAALRGSGLLAVHAVKVPDAYPVADLWADPDQPPWSRDLEGRLEQWLSPWTRRFPKVAAERKLSAGHPVQVLAAESGAADLVVVGGLGRTRFSGLRLGSVSRGLLHHAACPVAVIHAVPTAGDR